MCFDIAEKIDGRAYDGKAGQVLVKRMTIKGATVDMEERLVKGICTTESVDLDGDVVLQDGLDTEYFAGADKESGVRTVYLDHDYSQPIGTCKNLAKTKDGIYCATYITKRPIGDEILTLIQEKIIKGLSIGFRNLEATPPSMEEMVKYGPSCDRIIRRSMLLEYSVTAMPANPGAMLELQSLVAKSRVSRRLADLIVPAIPTPEPVSVVSGGRVFTIR